MRIYESLTATESAALDEMRQWALAQGETKEHLIGKVLIIQRVIDSGAVGAKDVWKMNALGVLFGDALQQALGDSLAWVVVDDDAGRAYALRWRQSEMLIYPLSAIKTRLLAQEPLDVQGLLETYRDMFRSPAV